MAAGLYLGRYRRDVLVVDGGASRAALIPISHNLPGFPDGLHGPDLLRLMRTHATRYGACIQPGRVMQLCPAEEGLTARIIGADGAMRVVEARAIILATGVVDIEPALPDLPDAIRRGLIRHCPICDGYEVTDRKVGIIGFGKAALGEAMFMRSWTSDITLLTLGVPWDLCEAEARAVAEAGIEMVEEPVARVVLEADRIAAIETRGGTRLTFDTLYSALGACVRSDLAVALGAANEAGCLVTDPRQETTIPNLFAAGDVTQALNQVAVAVAQAAIAATTIHRRLLGMGYGSLCRASMGVSGCRLSASTKFSSWASSPSRKSSTAPRKDSSAMRPLISSSPQPVSDTKPDSKASLPAMNVSAFSATAAASSVVSLGGAAIRAWVDRA